MDPTLPPHPGGAVYLRSAEGGQGRGHSTAFRGGASGKHAVQAVLAGSRPEHSCTQVDWE